MNFQAASCRSLGILREMARFPPPTSAPKVLLLGMKATPKSNLAEGRRKVRIPVEWYSMAVRWATKSGGVEPQVEWGGPTFSLCIRSTQYSSASTASLESKFALVPSGLTSQPPFWRTKASNSQSFHPPETVTPHCFTSFPSRTVSFFAVSFNSAHVSEHHQDED